MPENNSQKDTIVLYHSDCPDGFGAAYAAWKKFGNAAEYFPIVYKSDPPPDLFGKVVYILDYGYPAPATKKIAKEALSLFIIDHHISNEENIKLAHESLFDISHSGAVLAWKYFFPDQKIPLLLEYIEDNDLWTFRLPKSKEAAQAIGLYGFNFEVWDKMASDFEDVEKREIYFRDGETLVCQMNKMVSWLVGRAGEVSFEGYKSLIVNSPVFVSQIGNALNRKLPPIGVVWSVEDGRISVSLRSNGVVDVSKLAQKYGGGGHKAASGFIIDKIEDLNKIFKPIVKVDK